GGARPRGRLPLGRGARMTGTAAPLLALQTLTNLALVPAGPGLPSGWRLERVKGAAAPAVAVTAAHALRVTTARGAGFAVYRLPPPPAPAAGALAWQWRRTTPWRGRCCAAATATTRRCACWSRSG